MEFDKDKARKIIMDHYVNPRHFDKNILEKNVFYNNTCSDKLVVNATIEDNKLKDIKHYTQGCLICVSSASIFIDQIQNKNLSEVFEINNLYKKLLDKNLLSDSELEKLGNLWVFFNTKNHFNRLQCALMISKYIEKLEDESK